MLGEDGGGEHFRGRRVFYSEKGRVWGVLFAARVFTGVFITTVSNKGGLLTEELVLLNTEQINRKENCF